MGFRGGSYWKVIHKNGVDARGVHRYRRGVIIKDVPVPPGHYRYGSPEPQLCGPGVIHASPSLLDAIGYMQHSVAPMRFVEIFGRPVVGGGSYQRADKHGFLVVKVLDSDISKERAIALLMEQTPHCAIPYGWRGRVRPPLDLEQATAVVQYFTATRNQTIRRGWRNPFHAHLLRQVRSPSVVS